MIKAVLLDLDDTLITTHTSAIYSAYLSELGVFSAKLADPQVFVDQMLQTFYHILDEYNPTKTLETRFFDHFSQMVQHPREAMIDHFNEFYLKCYPALKSFVGPRPETPALLQMLFDGGYQVVVATNPGLPMMATGQRMAWGEVFQPDYRFETVTSLETMHFGKPHAEYYAEIAAGLGVKPSEAIMVGDSWDDDMIGAAAAGLHTYWVTENGDPPPDETVRLDGCGSYSQFTELTHDGWLQTLDEQDESIDSLLALLAAHPAVFDTMAGTHDENTICRCPKSKEWSARDIICHLRDHEAWDQERLQTVVEEDDPFLTSNLDPWANYETYCGVTFSEALNEFAEARRQTIEYLRSLSAEDWQSPARDSVFGPTSLEELVRFMVKHDRIHLCQLPDTLKKVAGKAAARS
ncbi:MAG: HAD-IA family hydrolase [Anaerolineae bacterium]|nr:HAD-IA family hydrolase [Anaerolineae bacterium]